MSDTATPEGHALTTDPSKAPAPHPQKRDAANIALKVWAVLVYAFLFLPIVVIVIYSFNDGRILAAWDSFGTHAYVSAWNNSIMKSSIVTSLKAAAGTAILATLIGTLGGIALARAGKRALWALGLTAVLAVSLVTPEIVDAIAMLPWFVSLGVDGGITPLNNGLVRLIVAHTVESMAVVTFIVRARMSGVDQVLEEAAGDLYAPPWRRFKDITLPMAAPGILAGALMAFTLSMDNTIVASFVQQPGNTPWPVYIFSQVRVALRPEVAALSSVMLLLTLATLAVVGYVLRRVGDNTTEVVKTVAG